VDIAITIGLGTFIGLLLGLTGAGGSIFAVPLLMATLGWSITQAATVSLLAVAVAATTGTGLAWRHSYVRYRAATLIAGIGVMIAPFGISLANHLRPSMLATIFAVVLGIVAVRMYRSALLSSQDATVVRAAVAGEGATSRGKICRVNPATGRLIWTWRVAGIISMIGATTGFLSGLLGVGGGFVVVPALRASTPLSMHSAVATSLMAIALTSMGTVITGYFLGRSLPLAVALPFVAGAVLGMALGRQAAPHIAGPKLQQGFAIVAGMVSLAMAAHAVAWI
jgi:uncharacterized membrane protein YfcA